MNILFLGDSITAAFRKPEEINPAYQLGNGYVFHVASRLAYEYAERPFQFANRGVSGYRIRNLLARWKEDLLACRPDLVSILIGVNDVMARKKALAQDLNDFELDYRRLIAEMQGVNQSLRIVLLEPFLLPAGGVTLEWRRHLQILQKRLRRFAEEYRVGFVPLQERFDRALGKAPAEYWAYDGIHPTHAGFELVARAWLRSTRDIFRSLAEIEMKNLHK